MRHPGATSPQVKGQISRREHVGAPDQWGRFLPEHTTAVSLLDRLLHHAVVVVTEGESFRMRQARANGGARTAKTRQK